MRAADSPCGSSSGGDTSLVLMGGFTAGDEARKQLCGVMLVCGPGRRLTWTLWSATSCSIMSACCLATEPTKKLFVMP